jgi:competence protein ComEC
MHAIVFGITAALICFALIIGLTSSARKTALLCCSLFALGFLRSYWQQATYATMLQSLQQTRALTLHAQVTDIKKAHHPRYKAILVCAVTAHQDGDEIASYAHTWNLQCYCASTPDCCVGDTIALHALHITPARNNDFGTFLLKENLHATAFINRTQYSVLHRPTWSFARALCQFRQELVEQLRTKCSAQTFNLMMLIFFGDRLQTKTEYEATKDLFNGWGIMHFLARSGLHLVIFILALNYCLRYVPIPFAYKKMLLACMCIVYHLLSWPSISFVRALLTFFWYTCYALCNLQIDGPRIVMLVTAICLLHNPMLLFFLDFQLSFGLTLVLAVITRYTTDRKPA